MQSETLELSSTQDQMWVQHVVGIIILLVREILRHQWTLTSSKSQITYQTSVIFHTSLSNSLTRPVSNCGLSQLLKGFQFSAPQVLTGFVVANHLTIWHSKVIILPQRWKEIKFYEPISKKRNIFFFYNSLVFVTLQLTQKSRTCSCSTIASAPTTKPEGLHVE